VQTKLGKSPVIAVGLSQLLISTLLLTYQMISFLPTTP